MKNIFPRPLRRLKRHLSTPRFQHSKTMQSWREIIVGNNRDNRLRQIFFSLVWNRVEGDYVEFGVASGKSLANAYYASQAQNEWYPEGHPFYSHERINALSKMRFFGFDSFKGLPKAKGLDKKFRFFDDGMILCPKDEVEKYLKDQRVDMSRVHLVEGFYSESLTYETRQKFQIGSVSMVFFDCDYYESTVEALAFITPHIVDGTIFLFDDWFLNNADPQLGVQRAFYEWCDAHKDFRVAPFIDQRTFVILKSVINTEPVS